MSEQKDKTLMRAIEVNQFNEDMKLIQKYSELIRDTTRKISFEKDFYMEEIHECNRVINFIWGYSNIIQKNDLKSARNYLRTGIANGSTAQMGKNMSKELKEILDDDKFWNEEINKNQIMSEDNKKPKKSASQRLNETLERYRGNSIDEKQYTKQESKNMIFSEEEIGKLASEVDDLFNDDEFWGDTNKK